MELPEFVKKIGWAISRNYKRIPSFVRRTLIVCLFIFVLWLVIWWLCNITLRHSGQFNSLENILKKIWDDKPQLEFITDLSAFVGVVLAIAVPLGIDIVQKVSGYYAGSRTIRERLQNEWQMQWLAPYYLVTIFLSLTTRFFFIDPTVHPEFQRSVEYVLLTLLLFGMVIFAWYINRLYIYTLDQVGLKKEIENGLEQAIHKKNKSKYKAKYLDLIEAYGDLIVSETRNANLKTVKFESLPLLEDLVKQIVPRGDLEEAEKFILSDEFYELSNRDKLANKGKVVTNSTTEEELADTSMAGLDEKWKPTWEDEAKFRLYFDPDRYALTYISTLQQIIRVYQEGIATKDSDLATQAIYSLVKILDYLSKEEGRGFYIEQLLRRLNTIAKQSASADDNSMYVASTQWYTTVVFDKYERFKENFLLEYLQMFDQALYSIVRFEIDENYKSLFVSFIGYLVDGLHEPLGQRTIWDLGHMPMRDNFQKYRDSGKADEIERATKDLEKSVISVSSIDELHNWQDRLRELNKLVRPLLNPDGKQKADKLTADLSRDTEERYKYANLRFLIFSIGAYCMFRRKFDFVKEVFDYKQPSDSDATWGGNDIQPDTPSSVVNFYFRRGLYQRNLNFWDGHHGSDIYAKQYFLCLLIRALQRNPSQQIQLADLTPSSLSSINYSVEELKNVAEGIQSDSELLTSMDIDKNIIQTRLIPALEEIDKQAKDKLKAIENDRPISSTKVKQFKDEVVKAHSEQAYARMLFAHYGKLEDSTSKKYDKSADRYGISRVDEKGVFFDEWYVSYGDWGKTYGSDLARSESYYLYEAIKKLSRVSPGVDTVEKAVAKLEQPVILASSRVLFRYEVGNSNFIPEWRAEDITIPEKELGGFAGAYVVSGIQIPVLEVSELSRTETEAVVVDMKKMPVLSLVSPLGVYDEPTNRVGGLSISVKAFSEDNDLTNTYIGSPPDWLKKVGSEAAQRSYLMSRVLIQIYERFVLKPTRYKVGYIVSIRKEL